MNSKERVEAALHFTGPDRIPTWKIGTASDIFVLIPLPSKNWKPGHNEEEIGLFPHAADDIIIEGGLWTWEKPEWARNDKRLDGNKWLKVPREEIDPWGNIWNRTGNNTSMGHPGRPNLKDWSKIDKYYPMYNPDLFDKSRFDLASKLKQFGAEKYRLSMLAGMGPFQKVQNLRGFSNFLLDHKRYPQELNRLLAHFTEMHIKDMDAWIKYGFNPHGFLLIEDLAAQNGPFMSPKMFRKFYEPVYKNLAKAAHDRGCTLFHHCCGKINELIPLLLEWGIDTIELDSPRMTGYDLLKPFRGKMMFWGCVNIQSIYTRGTPEQCEREVWHMMRNLGTPEGGFGAYFYPQTRHIKVPSENVRAFEKGLEKYGDYSKIPKHWWNHPTVEIWNDYEVPPLPPL